MNRAEKRPTPPRRLHPKWVVAALNGQLPAKVEQRVYPRAAV